MSGYPFGSPSRTGFATPSETFKYVGIQNVNNGVANLITFRILHYLHVLHGNKNKL